MYSLEEMAEGYELELDDKQKRFLKIGMSLVVQDDKYRVLDFKYSLAYVDVFENLCHAVHLIQPQ